MPTYRTDPAVVTFWTVPDPATSTGSPPVRLAAAMNVTARPGNQTGV
jgi:hypothetical protein